MRTNACEEKERDNKKLEYVREKDKRKRYLKKKKAYRWQCTGGTVREKR